MVICLERGADLHMAQLMPLPLWFLASVKSRLVLPFWYWLTWVVPEQGPLNVCVCVCCYRVCLHFYPLQSVACAADETGPKSSKKKIPSLLDIPVYSPGNAPSTLPPGTITRNSPR